MLLVTLENRKLLNVKKIFCISPLFHDNKYIASFQEKSEILNCFWLTSVFQFQREPSYLSNFHYGKIAHSICNFTKDVIIRIENRSGVENQIIICMLKICRSSNYRPFSIISETFFAYG